MKLLIYLLQRIIRLYLVKSRSVLIFPLHYAVNLFTVYSSTIEVKTIIGSNANCKGSIFSVLQQVLITPSTSLIEKDYEYTTQEVDKKVLDPLMHKSYRTYRQEICKKRRGIPSICESYEECDTFPIQNLWQVMQRSGISNILLTTVKQLNGQITS